MKQLVSLNMAKIVFNQPARDSKTQNDSDSRPIFLCYRQIDGKRHARWIFSSLRESLEEKGEIPNIYFDQTAPAVTDWQEVHRPSLERARALVVICTPGLYSDHGRDDWVHRELDWWLKKRSMAPIIVDATGEGMRWVPKKLKSRWPNLQRVNLDPELWKNTPKAEVTLVKRQVANQILGGVAESEIRVIHEDLVKSQKLNRRLWFSSVALSILAIGLIFAIYYAVNQTDKAIKQRNIATADRLAAQALNEIDDRLDLSLLLSIEASKLTENLETKGSLITALSQKPHIQAILQSKDSKIQEIAFSPQGKKLASVDQNGRIVLWNTELLNRDTSFSSGKQAVRTMSFGSNGEVLFLSGWENAVTCFDIASGNPLSDLTNDKIVSSVACSSKTTRFALGNADGTVSLGNTYNRQLTNTLPGHKIAIWDLCFSDDGTSLACSAWDEKIIVWNTSSPIIHELQFADNIEGYSLAFSPDGRTLATGGSKKVITLWDIEQCKLKAKLFSDNFAVSSIKFSPNGKILASGDQGGKIILWDVESYKMIRHIEAHSNGISSLAFNKEGDKFASASSDDYIILWDFKSFELFEAPLWCLDFNPRGDIIAIGMENGTVVFWSIDEHRILWSFQDQAYPVSSVTFSLNGDLLAMGSGDGSIIILDVNQQKMVKRLKGHSAAVAVAAFSPKNPSILATGGWDKNLIIWDVVENRIIDRLEGHKSKVSSLAFSPDGTTLATGSWDRSIILWDLESRKKIDEFRLHLSSVSCLEFSPNGEILASGSWDKTIILWDISNTNPPATLIAHKEAITDLSFSNDGSLLASGSKDARIVLWDVATKRQLGHPILGHQDAVTELAFSPRDEILISCSIDKTFSIWPATFESWLRHANRIANRKLTEEEWQQFFVDAHLFLDDNPN